jgi:dihydrofolate reductase
MRKICYGVAMSLDGYIAGPRGEADWIVADPDIDFGAMFAKYDTLVIGRKTFEGMVKAGRASVPGMKIVVFSKTLRAADYPEVTMVAGGLEDTVATLCKAPGKDIWLFGGGELFRSFLKKGLVDTVENRPDTGTFGRGDSSAAAARETRKPETARPSRLQQERNRQADVCAGFIAKTSPELENRIGSELR